MQSNAPARQISPAVGLRVIGLNKRYSVRQKLWRRDDIQPMNDVSFEIPPGTTLGLVGSSGSGKSTIARCVTRFETPDAGDIWLGDVNIARLSSSELRQFRRVIQMIFQDPVTSMNPRMSAAQIIAEPLLIQAMGTGNERRSWAAELMSEVGLSPEWLDRQISEFSGGQRQRIAIARALTLKPKVLVLDEALSGMDLSTQAQIAELLRKLQATHMLTYLLISHDLALVAQLADTVAIMDSGRIVEQGPIRQIMANPTRPETRALLAAANKLGNVFSAAQGAGA